MFARSQKTPIPSLPEKLNANSAAQRLAMNFICSFIQRERDATQEQKPAELIIWPRYWDSRSGNADRKNLRFYGFLAPALRRRQRGDFIRTVSKGQMPYPARRRLAALVPRPTKRRFAATGQQGLEMVPWSRGTAQGGLPAHGYSWDGQIFNWVFRHHPGSAQKYACSEITAIGRFSIGRWPN